MDFRNSITSLAILKAQWDVEHKDYIENFVPMFLYLIGRKRYEEITPDTLSKDFLLEFGLTIPYHPVETILTRLAKRGYITKEGGKWFADLEKISKTNFPEVRDREARKLSKLVKELQNYCANEGANYTDEKTSEVLLDFFRETELDLLFAIDEKPVIDLKKSENKEHERYLVGSFIAQLQESEPELFDHLLDVAIGYALANSILYAKHLQSYSGSPRGLNLYLDTGYIFSLLGAGEEARAEAFAALTVLLQKTGINLFVFEHTHQEIMGILSGARHWMRNKETLDPLKSSRILKYFLFNNFSESDVDLFISNVQGVLGKYGIKIVGTPSYSHDHTHHIDEAKFYELLKAEYSKRGYFDEWYQEGSVRKDIQSIYAICKLRRGNTAISLRDARHVFVTTNRTVARMSRLVDPAPSTIESIPPGITDTFLGTILWLENPTEAKNINRRKILAESYAAVQPSPTVIKRYVQEIDKLKKRKVVTEDEYFVLRESRVALNLLSEMTKGRESAFTPKTPMEILEEMRAGESIKAREALEREVERRKRADQELANARRQALEREVMLSKAKTLKTRIVSVAAIGASAIPAVPVVAVVGITIYIQQYPERFSQTLQIGSLLLSLILAITGISLFNFCKRMYVFVRPQLEIAFEKYFGF